ncbi:hypothetical protein H2200_004343 [Cladophialophora chaetospira]|uniref:Uncharacterized protein n=1 Tax=Cladophialophora chaetospira TaxID=386627 RepID=A0AA38XD20_9EURO|nr:hypothetical protein H2200_004343 [Cladophialophora chaetospira]
MHNTSNASAFDNRTRWYGTEFLLVRRAWYDRDDEKWDARSRELLLDPSPPPNYRAVLLSMIIHTDENPREILDEFTRMVEELEAMAIAENEPEDGQVKQLRELVVFLEENFWKDCWDSDGEEEEGRRAEGGEERESQATIVPSEGEDAGEEEEGDEARDSQATTAPG